MVQVNLHDVELLNDLTKRSDKSRESLTSTLLTVYGAVVSGLFLLVTTSNSLKTELSSSEKFIFLVISLSAISIVFMSLLEKLLMFFASVQVGKKQAKKMREGLSSKITVLNPNTLTTSIIKLIPWLLILLLTINVLAIGCYIVSRI